jgi:hypothetical protein
MNAGKSREASQATAIIAGVLTTCAYALAVIRIRAVLSAARNVEAGSFRLLNQRYR